MEKKNVNWQLMLKELADKLSVVTIHHMSTNFYMGKGSLSKIPQQTIAFRRIIGLKQIWHVIKYFLTRQSSLQSYLVGSSRSTVISVWWRKMFVANDLCWKFQEKKVTKYFTACFALTCSRTCPVLHIFSVTVSFLLWVSQWIFN